MKETEIDSWVDGKMDGCIDGCTALKMMILYVYGLDN